MVGSLESEYARAFMVGGFPVGLLVAIWLLCGLLGGVLTARRRRSFGIGFVLGALLGPIGVLFAIWYSRAGARVTGSRLARFNRRVTNPVTLRLGAGQRGPYSVVLHRGRRSGRSYRTPVVSHREGAGWLIALPYGAETHWVQNLLAAGRGALEVGGEVLPVVAPEVVEPPRLPREVPWVNRATFRLLGVTEFIRLTAAEDTERRY